MASAYDLEKMEVGTDLVIWWVGHVKCFVRRVNYALFQAYHVNYEKKNVFHIGFECSAGAILRRTLSRTSPLNDENWTLPTWKRHPRWYWKVARIENRKLKNRLFEALTSRGQVVTDRPKFKVIQGGLIDKPSKIVQFPFQKVNTK